MTGCDSYIFPDYKIMQEKKGSMYIRESGYFHV